MNFRFAGVKLNESHGYKKNWSCAIAADTFYVGGTRVNAWLLELLKI
jgi:hypothetical protein